jgi:NitT/TauT family transport system ATP-binding protein
VSESEIIRFQGVTKIFDSGRGHEACALKNLDFTVRDQEIISFVGPSGCGKTTVLRILSGLEHQTSGEVSIKGRPVEMGLCGMVFQSYSSFPWLTILDNVAFGLKLKNIDKETRFKEARKYIDLVGLSKFEKRYPKELSGGQKQRVAIARTLAVQHNIILMDEPFGALDIKIRAEMQELLLGIWRAIRPTILLVTHDIQEAIYLPNRIFVFSRPPDPSDGKCQGTEIKIIEIDKDIGARTQEWKNSLEFESFEKKLKGLQFE